MDRCYRCNEVISMCQCDESIYTADDEISRLRAELAECKQQLSRYQRMVNEAAQHMVCENVHHEKSDQHGLDEDCPVVARWHALAAKEE